MEEINGGNPEVTEVRSRMAKLDQDSRRTEIANMFLTEFSGSLTPELRASILAAIAAKNETKRENTQNGQENIQNIEDEIAAAVKGMNVYGKFRTGVKVNNKEIITPNPDGMRDFMAGAISPDADRFMTPDLREMRQYFYRYFGENRDAPRFATILSLPDKDPQSRLIGMFIPQAGVDGFGRALGNADISFKLPQDKAQELMQMIVERPDGADVTERLLQNVAPGLIADGPEGSGIKRPEMKELYVLNDQTINAIRTQKKVTTRELSTATIKPYSSPVQYAKK